MAARGILMLVGMCALSSKASAGKVAKIFSEDVFGVPWDATGDEVKRVYPGGESKSERGMSTYTIQDDRPLFGVKREKDNYIKFIFDTDGLAKGVSVEFPIDNPDNFVVLLNKLIGYFGEYSYLRHLFETNYAEWPEDDGITLFLDRHTGTLHSGDSLIFTVRYRPEEPGKISKEQLGF